MSNMNVAYLMQSKSRAFLVLCIGYVSFSNWYYHNLLASSHTRNGNDSSNPIDELIDKNQLPSLHILFKFMKNYVPPDEQKLQSPLEADEESERCQRFGFEYAGRKTRRRIFFGSLIADDSWHAILTHAAETHGLYHSVSLVESNATTSTNHSHSRKPRFTSDSTEFRVLQSGIFGPSAIVTVDFYADHPADRQGFSAWNGVEERQRELILHKWKQNGMTVDDIGIIGDLDEMFSRDFLLAAQSCDVPEFRPQQDCRNPKLLAKTLVFESSPECVTEARLWFHPDMMIGQCIDTIGDSNVHKPGKRDWNGKGPRVEGYGLTSTNYSMMPNTTMFPLWKPQDFRNTEGGRSVPGDQKYSAFHLHNFFTSVKVMRNKYVTYGHAVARAGQKPLGKIHPDINLAINCITQRPNAPDAGYKRIEGGFDAIDGPTPVLFQQLVEYRMARHQELKGVILKDEEQFGIYISTSR